MGPRTILSGRMNAPETPRKRRRYLVDRHFQLRFFLTRWVVALVVASGAVAFSTLLLYVFWYARYPVHTAWSNQAGIVALLLLVAVAILLVRWAIRISHRVSGSLARIRGEMGRVMEGDLSHRWQLRQGDQMEPMVEMLNGFISNLETHVAAERQEARRLERELLAVSTLLEGGETAEARRRLAAAAAEVGRLLSRFRLSPDPSSASATEGAAVDDRT